MDINTTPLIDVMLVLLIMFIITIPLPTHAVKLQLPGTGPTVVDSVSNQIDIDFLGNIYWNREPVDSAGLRRNLRAAVALPTQPELRLKPEGLARYEIVDEVMATAQKAGVTKMGFVGNEAYAN